MATTSSIILLLVLLPVALCNQDLSSVYPFNVTLVEDAYWLYWNFNHTTQVINFAVRVKTTGWIGFGISPNGQMPGSDVVIGWIDGSNSYFHDRYAFERRTPPIDPEQNWFLTSATEDNGYTTLQFYRNFITCDDLDLDILYQTIHVIYSWNDNKPTVDTDPSGDESYTFMRHTTQGTTDVNLLGGLPNPPKVIEDVTTFSITVDQIAMPSSGTTYWCKGVRLPNDILQNKRYVIKFSPSIAIGSEPYVHHMLIYVCNGLEESDLGPGGICLSGSSDTVSERISACTGSLLIGAWAIGGTDFYYPENVAYPIGGPDDFQFAVVEIHYNNPDRVSGVIDSSGMTFTYIDTGREHDGGILYLGHVVTNSMIIPPKAVNYTVSGICPTGCTQNIPAGGLHVFANLLHTHLAGVGATLRHISSTDCGSTTRTEELAPIEKNLNYDFNFQQITYLPQEIIVQPGDTLIVECIYNTVDRSGVTLGGLSTQEEMCLSFVLYYPRVPATACDSLPRYNQIAEFVINFVPAEHQALFTAANTTEKFIDALNILDWTQEMIDGFQNLIYTEGLQYSMCTDSDVFLPSPCCSYEANNTCTGYVPSPCCQRQCQYYSGANIFSFSIALVIITTMLSMIVLCEG